MGPPEPRHPIWGSLLAPVPQAAATGPPRRGFFFWLPCAPWGLTLTSPQESKEDLRSPTRKLLPGGTQPRCSQHDGQVPNDSPNVGGGWKWPPLHLPLDSLRLCWGSHEALGLCSLPLQSTATSTVPEVTGVEHSLFCQNSKLYAEKLGVR